jgi:hypothetical protein
VDAKDVHPDTLISISAGAFDALAAERDRLLKVAEAWKALVKAKDAHAERLRLYNEDLSESNIFGHAVDVTWADVQAAEAALRELGELK